MAERAWNFSAGPAVLPERVLRQAQQDLWDLDGTGIGICEHSHRGAAFDRVIAEAEEDCRRVGNIPDSYRVLFLQGGASLQFAMVPANFLGEDQTADYLVTGAWSQKAIKEAALYGTAHTAASSQEENFSYIPKGSAIGYSDSPVYVHMTSNNTIFGTQYRAEPDIPDGAFLVCDASSDIFSRPIDVTKYGLIYAGAQKNLGPSGTVLVIVREDLLERSARSLPTMLRYQVHAEKGSRYNTPNTFGIYLMGQVFKWILAEGGLAKMQERNERKARLIYDVIDEGDFYRGTARAEDRSLMNIPFRLPSEDLEKKFLSEAGEHRMSGLKGHRSVGGIRASIYNAFPEEGCRVLADFMRDFARRNG